jgi:hypothetical protein
MWAAVEQYALGFEMAGKVNQRIDPYRKSVRGGNVALAVDSASIILVNGMFGIQEVIGKLIALCSKRCKGKYRQE